MMVANIMCYFAKSFVCALEDSEYIILINLVNHMCPLILLEISFQFLAMEEPNSQKVSFIRSACET